MGGPTNHIKLLTSTTTLTLFNFGRNTIDSKVGSLCHTLEGPAYWMTMATLVVPMELRLQTLVGGTTFLAFAFTGAGFLNSL